MFKMYVDMIRSPLTSLMTVEMRLLKKEHKIYYDMFPL